jgi:hypothetical protein
MSSPQEREPLMLKPVVPGAVRDERCNRVRAFEGGAAGVSGKEFP